MFINEVLDSFDEYGKVILSEEYNSSVVIDIVITSLYNTNRFNGITKVPYNLIKHSLFVSRFARDLYTIFKETKKEKTYWQVGIMGLLHDLGEVIVGDTVYPIKKRYSLGYENGIEKAFIEWFIRNCLELDLCYDDELHDNYIKRADRKAGLLELLAISKEKVFSLSSYIDESFLSDAVPSDKESFMNELNFCIENYKRFC